VPLFPIECFVLAVPARIHSGVSTPLPILLHGSSLASRTNFVVFSHASKDKAHRGHCRISQRTQPCMRTRFGSRGLGEWDVATRRRHGVGLERIAAAGVLSQLAARHSPAGVSTSDALLPELVHNLLLGNRAVHRPRRKSRLVIVHSRLLFACSTFLCHTPKLQ